MTEKREFTAADMFVWPEMLGAQIEDFVKEGRTPEGKRILILDGMKWSGVREIEGQLTIKAKEQGKRVVVVRTSQFKEEAKDMGGLMKIEDERFNTFSENERIREENRRILGIVRSCEQKILSKYLGRTVDGENMNWPEAYENAKKTGGVLLVVSDLPDNEQNDLFIQNMRGCWNCLAGGEGSKWIPVVITREQVNLVNGYIPLAEEVVVNPPLMHQAMGIVSQLLPELHQLVVREIVNMTGGMPGLLAVALNEFAADFEINEGRKFMDEEMKIAEQALGTQNMARLRYGSGMLPSWKDEDEAMRFSFEMPKPSRLEFREWCAELMRLGMLRWGDQEKEWVLNSGLVAILASNLRDKDYSYYLKICNTYAKWRNEEDR